MASIKLTSLDLDPKTHTRTGIDPQKVDRFVELLQEGITLPPIVTYFDGETYWVADGYHRVSAHKKLELEDIEAVALEGTSRDAFLAGLAYDDETASKSTEDKKSNLEKLLDDPEWSQWSSKVLALKCGLSKTTVNRLRKPGPRKGEDGKVYKSSKPKKKSGDPLGHLISDDKSTDSKGQKSISKSPDLDTSGDPKGQKSIPKGPISVSEIGPEDFEPKPDPDSDFDLVDFDDEPEDLTPLEGHGLDTSLPDEPSEDDDPFFGLLDDEDVKKAEPIPQDWLDLLREINALSPKPATKKIITKVLSDLRTKLRWKNPAA